MVGERQGYIFYIQHNIRPLASWGVKARAIDGAGAETVMLDMELGPEFGLGSI